MFGEQTFAQLRMGFRLVSRRARLGLLGTGRRGGGGRGYGGGGEGDYIPIATLSPPELLLLLME